MNLKKIQNKYVNQYKKNIQNYSSGDLVEVSLFDDGQYVKTLKLICVKKQNKTIKTSIFYDLDKKIFFYLPLTSKVVLSLFVIQHGYMKKRKNDIRKYF